MLLLLLVLLVLQLSRLPVGDQASKQQATAASIWHTCCHCWLLQQLLLLVWHGCTHISCAP
jgi:hypothetical protein